MPPQRRLSHQKRGVLAAVHVDSARPCNHSWDMDHATHRSSPTSTSTGERTLFAVRTSIKTILSSFKTTRNWRTKRRATSTPRRTAAPILISADKRFARSCPPRRPRSCLVTAGTRGDRYPGLGCTSTTFATFSTTRRSWACADSSQAVRRWTGGKRIKDAGPGDAAARPEFTKQREVLYGA